MNMQKVGGYAAVVAAIQFAVVLVIRLGVMAPLGVYEMETPADKVLAVAAQSATPFLVLYVIIGLFSITIILVALALYERLQVGAPNRMRLSVIAASIVSALYLAANMILVSSILPAVAHNDVVGFGIIDMLTQGLKHGTTFAFGMMCLLWGWAGLRTKGLPTLLCYILLVAGVVALLAHPIPVLNPLKVILNIVFLAWLGYVLLTQPTTVAAQPQATM